jgi:hypothetical protein
MRGKLAKWREKTSRLFLHGLAFLKCQRRMTTRSCARIDEITGLGLLVDDRVALGGCHTVGNKMMGAPSSGGRYGITV